MENVVYLLGAEFSAPLGLPVMKDFLLKSKDLYFQNRDEYGHFVEVIEEVIEEINSLNDLPLRLEGTKK